MNTRALAVILIAATVGAPGPLDAGLFSRRPARTAKPVASVSPSKAVEALPPHIAQWQPNVCRVKSGSSLGTGVYLGDRLVLTAEHVVDNGGKLSVTFHGQGTYQGVIVGINSTHDVAFIRIEEPAEANIKGVLLADENPDKGSKTWQCGYGSTGRLTWHSGTVQQYTTTERGGAACWFESVPYAVPGDSGGPVFNADGELLGNLWGGGPRSGTTTAVLPSTLVDVLGPEAHASLVAYHVECFGGSCGPKPRIFSGLFGRSKGGGGSKSTYPAPGGIPAGENPQAGPGSILPFVAPSIIPDVAPVPVAPDPVATAPILAGPPGIKGDTGQRGPPGPVGTAGAPGQNGTAGTKIAGAVIGGESIFAKAAPALFSALGLSTPPTAAILAMYGLGMWWKRRKRNGGGGANAIVATTPLPSTPVPSNTYIVDAPQAQGTHRIDTQFVNVESDHYQRAHELARQQVARRYPGAQDILEAELSLTRQYASGLPN